MDSIPLNLATFNDDDADFVITLFNYDLESLRRELNQAKSRARIADDEQEYLFFAGYTEVVELAIQRIRFMLPKPKYSDNSIDFTQIKASCDIVQSVERYIVLKQRGKLYIGLCPIHNEKTPSFTVYPDSQTWHCFGCGKRGDIFDFIQAVELCDIKQAAAILRG